MGSTSEGDISSTFDLVFFPYGPALYLGKYCRLMGTLQVALLEWWLQVFSKSVHLHDRLQTTLFSTEKVAA